MRLQHVTKMVREAEIVNPSGAINRELKHATFLSHRRQPEANISHARTVVSLRFLN